MKQSIFESVGFPEIKSGSVVIDVKQRSKFFREYSEDTSIKGLFTIFSAENQISFDAKNQFGTMNEETGGVSFPAQYCSTLLVLVPQSKFRRKYAIECLKKGIFTLIYMSRGTYRKEYTLNFILRGVPYQIHKKLTKIRVYNWFFHKTINWFFEQYNHFKYKSLFRVLTNLLNENHQNNEKTITENQLKNILFINSSLAAGGAERQLVNLCTGLNREGHSNLTLCCLSPAGEHKGLELDFYLPQLVSSDIRVEDMLVANIDKFGFIGNPLSVDKNNITSVIKTTLYQSFLFDYGIYDFVNYIEENQNEIIHLWQDETCLVGGVAAVCLFKNAKVILNVRSLAPYNFGYFKPWMREAYLFLLKFPQVQIVANSHAGAKSYADWLGICESKISVVHNSFDFSLHKGKKICVKNNAKGKKKKHLIGGVFRLDKAKDPILWLQTAKKILTVNPNIEFRIAGNGPMLFEVRNKIETLGISKNVKLLGTVEDIFSEIKMFDLLLLTSVIEGLPNAILEAQALGVPVVSTDCGGASEVFVNGTTGRLAVGRSATELASISLECLENKEWLDIASKESVKFIADQFNVPKMVSEYSALYHDVLTR